MNLIIDCTLSEPPSEVTCFRDVTMYSKIFHFEDVLLSCKKGTRSIYWEWLKNNGAHDYITYVLNEEENETGILMHPNKGDIVIDRITAFNLHYVISKLKLISNNF
jgi:hypothetical protein